jgi:beta-lactamase regulating signal transducer with metallopeptidase domain
MKALFSLFAVLWFVAMIIKLIVWILGAILLCALFLVVRYLLRVADARREAEARRAAQIAARAEQQHRWVLRGDDRGVYGEYPVDALFSKPTWSQLR